MILSLEEDKKLAFAQIQKDIKSFTYPIFTQKIKENQSERPEQVASGVAVKFKGNHFLCTAAHVLENNFLNGQDVILPNALTLTINSANTKFIELEIVDSIFTKKEKKDFDLCLINVDKIKDNFNFIDENKITHGDQFTQNSIQILLGFPSTKNEPPNKYSKNFGKNEIETGYQMVQIKLDSSINFNTYNKNKNIHIAFKYRVGYDIDGISKYGALTSLRGVSGGGVWIVPTIFEPRKIYLAGILIECYNKEAFATKALYLKKLYSEWKINILHRILDREM